MSLLLLEELMVVERDMIRIYRPQEFTIMIYPSHTDDLAYGVSTGHPEYGLV